MAKYTSDKKIIRGLLNGEEGASTIIVQYLNLAFRSWQRRLGKRKDEIFSDVFYKLLIKLRDPSFKIKKTLKAYINGILSHTCSNYTRKENVDFDDELLLSLQPDQSPNPEQNYDLKEQLGIFYRVMTRLPSECRKLLYMLIIEELKYREIAKIEAKSEGYVKWRVSKCRTEARNIREELL